jgi:hypothetical protein
MSTEFLDDVFKYITEDTLNNMINNNYIKCIGIESNLNLTNENNKKIGKVVLIHYSDDVPKNKRKKSLLLGMLVEFLDIKIDWSDARYNMLHIVMPHFVKPYKQELKLSVPIDYYDRQTGKKQTGMSSLTYEQFLENRLCKFYYLNDWKFKWVNAYKNFRYMFAKSGQYYLAINSTVKHHFIPQPALLKIISQVNNERKRIKTEWMTYLRADAEKSKLFEMQMAIEDKNFNDHSNVINFHKF